MKVIRDIWICGDCLQVAVNGDYSGLDYSYSEEEAKAVALNIDKGLESLPGLVPDFGGEDQRECRECGHTAAESDFELVKTNPDPDDPSYEEQERECPECHSYDTRERDSGEDEFSRSECDCCGSALAGARYRMAQIVYEETAS